MKDVIVVAGATHNEGMMNEYAEQLAAADVPFHLEPLDPMPDGPNSYTMARRVQFFRSMAEKFIDYKVIYATDAWDVLFFGTKQDLIDKAPKTMLWAAERNCYPEKLEIYGSTPWRYANAGLTAFNPQFALGWCDAAEDRGEQDILDQAWLNRRLSKNSLLAPIDHLTRLFYVVSLDLEDGSLRVKNGRLWNASTGTFPSFFHFSGKCPTEEVRRLLNEG